MENIQKFLRHNSKYSKLSKPLTAAAVCDVARTSANGRFVVMSFHDGLLTVGCQNAAEATNLQFEKDKLIAEINAKLGKELVQKLRFKII